MSETRRGRRWLYIAAIVAVGGFLIEYINEVPLVHAILVPLAVAMFPGIIGGKVLIVALYRATGNGGAMMNLFGRLYLSVMGVFGVFSIVAALAGDGVLAFVFFVCAVILLGLLLLAAVPYAIFARFNPEMRLEDPLCHRNAPGTKPEQVTVLAIILLLLILRVVAEGNVQSTLYVGLAAGIVLVGWTGVNLYRTVAIARQMVRQNE